MAYPLPKKTTEIISRTSSENFGLLYSRLQEIKRNKEKNPFEDLQRLVVKSERIYQKQQTSIKSLDQRFNFLLDNAAHQGSECLNFSLKVAWRLVIGLGNPSVFDTGLRLHSIYGFPYLPGQGLKGAIRRVWMLEASETLGVPILEVMEIKKRHDANRKKKTPWEKFGNLLITAINPASKKYRDERNSLEKDFSNLLNDDFVSDGAEIKKLSYEKFWNEYASLYQIIFGGANGQGKVDFLDVYPTELIIGNKSILEVDIINAHYGEYYTSQGQTPPADYLSPNPIFFLCVRKNTPFQFRAIIKDNAIELKDKIEQLIKDTARDYGLGAKTMSGYGEMN